MVDVGEPSDLGLPYSSWRSYENSDLTQKDLVEELIELFEDYDCVLFEAPTGTGKTGVAMAVANYFNWDTYHLTSTKQLQDQILEDFEFVNTIKGRGNYECNMFPRLTAGDCPYAKVNRGCPLKDSCNYMVARDECLNSGVRVLNYKYHLFSNAYTDFWPNSDLMILDECHNAESELMGFVGHSFSYDDFHEMDTKFPGREETDLIIEKLEKARDNVGLHIQQLEQNFQRTLDGEKNLSDETLEELSAYKNYMYKLNMVLNNFNETYWIVDYNNPAAFGGDWEDAYVTMKPIMVKAYTDLLLNADKALFMSATIGDKETFCDNLGLKQDKVGMLSTDTGFDRNKRPFVYYDVAKVSRDNMDNAIVYIIDFLDDFISKHRDEKGIVHTISYNLGNRILENSIHTHNIIHHIGDGYSRADALYEFKHSEPPSILLSPSMDEGVDFAGDDARWQVILKFPFLSLGDGQVKQRQQIDQDWYAQESINRLVQTYGRIVRSEDDYGVTYFLDKNFDWMYNSNKNKFPDWFKEAIATPNKREYGEQV